MTRFDEFQKWLEEKRIKEEEQKEKAHLIKQGLSKLTEEERIALGLK